MSWIKPQELRWFLPAAIASARAALKTGGETQEQRVTSRMPLTLLWPAAGARSFTIPRVGAAQTLQ